MEILAKRKGNNHHCEFQKKNDAVREKAGEMGGKDYGNHGDNDDETTIAL
jgi:hypothetical protein